MNKMKSIRPCAPGEITVCFDGQTKSLQDVFGRAVMPVARMNARLWNFARANGLLALTTPPLKRGQKGRSRRHRKH